MHAQVNLGFPTLLKVKPIGSLNRHWACDMSLETLVRLAADHSVPVSDLIKRLKKKLFKEI